MTGTGNTKLTGWIGWMIGALGLAGVAVVGVNMLKVAGEVDARAEAREAAAVDHGMRLLGEVAAGDMLSYTQWDEALDEIVWNGSQAWMRDNIGRATFPDSGKERMLVLDGEGRAIFASNFDGEPDVEGGARTAEAAAGAVGRARALYLKAMAEDLYLDDRYGDGLYYGIYAHDVVRDGGVPALVVVAPLVGETEEVEVPDQPFMLVNVQPMTADLLARLGSLADLEGVALAPDDEAVAGPAYAVRDAAGRPVARLTWDHVPPGASVLRSAAPALALSAFVFLALSWLVSATLRRATRALAASEQAARHAARHDPATGLANRGWFLAEFGRIAALPGDGKGTRAVALIDCDYFKSINDTLGHAAGDAVLVAVAERLRGLGGKIELAARLGGDEFTAITAPCASRDEREWLVAAIADALMRPVQFQGQAIPVSVSIGATEIHAGEATDAALARADMALYRAKRDGRGCCRLHDPRLDLPAGAPAPEDALRRPRGERTGSSAVA